MAKQGKKGLLVAAAAGLLLLVFGKRKEATPAAAAETQAVVKTLADRIVTEGMDAVAEIRAALLEQAAPLGLQAAQVPITGAAQAGLRPYFEYLSAYPTPSGFRATATDLKTAGLEQLPGHGWDVFVGAVYDANKDGVFNQAEAAAIIGASNAVAASLKALADIRAAKGYR